MKWKSNFADPPIQKSSARGRMHTPTKKLFFRVCEISWKKYKLEKKFFFRHFNVELNGHFKSVQRISLRWLDRQILEKIVKWDSSSFYFFFAAQKRRRLIFSFFCEFVKFPGKKTNSKKKFFSRFKYRIERTFQICWPHTSTMTRI